MAEYYPKYIPDPVHCVNSSGKPTLDVSHPYIYNITEKEGMSEIDRMAFKQFELYRLMQRMDRRDSVVQTFTTIDFTNGSTLQHYLGTPFPVIEPQPHIMEVYRAVRWYEHLISIGSGFVYYWWLTTKPNTRFGTLRYGLKWLGLCVGFCIDWGWTYRALLRLTGQSPNDTECYKYGVIETPQRLREKAENWRQYAEYKEEWMRRYNYYIWGQRPGESYTLLSCCHLPYKPVRYNKKTDYPQRRNPFVLSAKPLSELMMDWGTGYYYPLGDDVLSSSRPDMKYMGRRMFQGNEMGA